MVLLTTLLLSLFITMALIPILKNHAVRLEAMDIPNGRSVHTYPKPKIGGIAMALGMVIPVLIWAPRGNLTVAILLGALVVFVFGVVDDRRELNYKSKFFGQVLAAMIVIFYGGLTIKSLGVLLPGEMLLPDWIAVPLTLLVIVGVTNAINLSDGLDGLAGGISLLCFSCIGIIAYQIGNINIAVISVAVVGAIFAFLRFNTHPAIIFMGDAGSLLLGFLAVTLSIGLSQTNNPISPLFPLLVLGFPILDTLTVMVERLSEGRSPFLADKNHFHHKLMKLGFLHSEAVFIIYLLQAALVTFAFIFKYHSEWFLLLSYMAFCGLIIGVFIVTDKTGWQIQRNSLLTKLIMSKITLLQDKSIFIKIAYWAVLLFLPSLLLFTCLLPARIPTYLQTISMSLAGFIFLVMLFRQEWMEPTLRLSMYFLIPLLVYECNQGMVSWLDPHFERIYNFSFGVLIIFVIWLLKFTRRQHGFKTTPTDFLILFIALIVPNLPDAHIQSYHMGLYATKLIVLLFSYEVLIGELRGELNGLGLTTIAAMLVVAVRGAV